MRQNLFFSATMAPAGALASSRTRSTTPVFIESAAAPRRSRPSTRRVSPSATTEDRPAGRVLPPPRARPHARLHAHQAPRRPAGPRRSTARASPAPPSTATARQRSARTRSTASRRRVQRARGDRHRRPRHRRRGHLPRHQLRHPGQPRGLRAPHRPHGARRRQRHRGQPAHRRRRPRAQGDRAPHRRDLDRHDLPGFDYDKRDIPESHLVPRKPGKLVYNGGARRSASREIRRKAPRRSAG